MSDIDSNNDYCNDYLFDDGYVEYLSTLYLKECGVHIYDGKVNPAMWEKEKSITICGSYCRGRDQTMYSLEFLLNAEGKDSVTSGACLWKRKKRYSITPCEVKDVNISKCEYGEPGKKRKHKYVRLQNIDHDPSGGKISERKITR